MHAVPRETTTGTRRPPRCDLRARVRAGIPEPQKICDGVLYRGHLHQLIGPPEAGKSTLAAWWALQMLRAGETVVWLDEESGPDLTAEKLISLGAVDDDLDPDRFVYIPFAGFTWNMADRAGLDELLADVEPALVVADSSSALMSAAGLDELSNSDASQLYRAVFLHAARQHGAAVVVLDHVTKSDDRGSGRYSRGASAKLGLVDVSLRLDVITPFDQAQSGQLKLTVGKDRRGRLRRAFLVDVETGGGQIRVRVAVRSASGAEGTDGPVSETMPPAAVKLLVALQGREGPATLAELLGDVVASGKAGFSRETGSKKLGFLVARGLAVELPPLVAGGPKRWVLPD